MNNLQKTDFQRAYVFVDNWIKSYEKCDATIENAYVLINSMDIKKMEIRRADSFIMQLMSILDIPQKDFARATGLHYTTVSQLKVRNKKITVDKVRDIRRALELAMIDGDARGSYDSDNQAEFGIGEKP